MTAMIAYVLFNKDTPGERLAHNLVDRLESAEVDAQPLDADSPRGIQLVENYDILGRPAVALIREDGTAMQIWQGEDSLPAPTDVAYLVHQ
jgi:hypothetical protein